VLRGYNIGIVRRRSNAKPPLCGAQCGVALAAAKFDYCYVVPRGAWRPTMNLNSVLSLKTDDKLLAAVRLASQHRLNADELLEQRVSFVFGSMSSRDSGVTKDQVRQVILEQQGGVLHK